MSQSDSDATPLVYDIENELQDAAKSVYWDIYTRDCDQNYHGLAVCRICR